jgi:integrase/recombinase XerD
MLEKYFVRPETLDRIGASWIGGEVERYVAWLDEQGYSSRSVLRRVPLVLAFGEFARAGGAVGVEDLPVHVEEFVAERVARYPCARRCGESETRRQVAKEVRGPIEQMLRLAVPGFVGRGRRRRPDPFVEQLPGSTGTWLLSVAFQPRRLAATSITCLGSSRIWRGSASPGCRSSRRRS